MKILAVDDDHAVRVSLNVMFRKWSDVVLEVAEEAQSAMEMLSKDGLHLEPQLNQLVQ